MILLMEEILHHLPPGMYKTLSIMRYLQYQLHQLRLVVYRIISQGFWASQVVSQILVINSTRCFLLDPLVLFDQTLWCWTSKGLIPKVHGFHGHVQLGSRNSHITVFICTPESGGNDPTWLAYIFQMDWFNHQLDKVRGNFEKEMAMAHYTAASKSGFVLYFQQQWRHFAELKTWNSEWQMADDGRSQDTSVVWHQSNITHFQSLSKVNLMP